VFTVSVADKTFIDVVTSVAINVQLEAFRAGACEAAINVVATSMG
jgi:hypothetical protein